MKTLLSLSLLAALACAAPTKFLGDAHIEGGPAKCTSICQAWGMDLVGMVANGEYSDGCICQVKGAKLSVADVGGALLAQGGNAAMIQQWNAEQAAKSH